ncbi:MAG: HD domain-containing protein, partial [Planctomycetota bacterium]|nr:HD domain-containing protein [Planctomycetota bacterium]
MLRFDHIIRDPVHGDVPLTSEELRILDTVEMQRLRNIRQLGTAYLVYPGAQHSRFEHSVGTAHFASKMIREIYVSRDQDGGRLGGFDDHEERVVRLAALVHDATHLPFGHNIEDQTGLLPRHDVPDRFSSLFSLNTELGQELERTGVRQQVLGILAPEAVSETDRPPAHWREIVSGTIDADMLDYLARDAMFTGLNLQYDSRIFSMFRVERRTQRLYVELESRGYLKEAILSELLRCLDARYFFSERVYYHHAKIASGALIAKAVEIALLEGVVDFSQLQCATDAGLLSMLAKADLGDSPEGARLKTFVDAYNSRRLPKRAAVYPVYANQNAQEGLIQRFFGAGSA